MIFFIRRNEFGKLVLECGSFSWYKRNNKKIKHAFAFAAVFNVVVFDHPINR